MSPNESLDYPLLAPDGQPFDRPAPAYAFDQLLSPWNLAIISLIVSIGCTLIPPSIYMYYVREPDFMFLDFQTYLLLITCTAAFSFASYWAYHLLSPPSLLPRSLRVTRLGLTLLISLDLGLLSIRIIHAQTTVGLPRILSTLFFTSDLPLREEIIDAISGAHLGWISEFTLALTVFILWVAAKTVRPLPPLHRIGILLSVVTFLFVGLLTLSRDVMLTFILMCVMLYIADTTVSARLSRLRVGLMAGGFVAVALLIFSTVNYVRASEVSRSDAELGARALVGYFPASYNRLAAVVHGYLTLPQAGWGYYSTEFIWYFPVVSQLFDLKEFGATLGLELPASSLDNWRAQFSYVSAARLNPSFIWVTAFGYAFLDFGWWAPAYFALQGIVLAILYRAFVNRSLIGIVVYPFVGTCVLKWFTIAYLGGRIPWICLIVAVLINGVRRLSTTTADTIPALSDVGEAYDA